MAENTLLALSEVLPRGPSHSPLHFPRACALLWAKPAKLSLLEIAGLKSLTHQEPIDEDVCPTGLTLPENATGLELSPKALRDGPYN